MLVDREFLLSCSTRNLTSLLRSLVIYPYICAPMYYSLKKYQNLSCFENRISSEDNCRHGNQLLKMVVLFFKKGFIFIIILQTLFWLRLANSSEEKFLLWEQWPLNILLKSCEGAISTRRRLGSCKGVFFEQ